MPTSRSPKILTEQQTAAAPAHRSRLVWPLVLIALLAILIVMLLAAPASMVKRFLPPDIRADDFSGTLWHGSAGRLMVDSRDAGAIEWRIHPGSLLALTVSADLHWVKIGFSGDGRIEVDRHGVTAHDIVGGGPIEDLNELGLAGWRGTARFKFSELALALAGNAATVRSAVGDVGVADLASSRIAGGDDLGGYSLHVANGAITPDNDATAELSDTGGPLEVHGVIHFSAQEHLGLLSGTVKERPAASAALRGQLDDLAQLHARDAAGRIPVELEFTF